MLNRFKLLTTAFTYLQVWVSKRPVHTATLSVWTCNGGQALFLTSNYSNSAKSNIKQGEVHKTERLITIWHKSNRAASSSTRTSLNRRQLLNLGGERNIWAAHRTQNWPERSRWSSFLRHCKLLKTHIRRAFGRQSGSLARYDVTDN